MNVHRPARTIFRNVRPYLVSRSCDPLQSVVVEGSRIVSILSDRDCTAHSLKDATVIDGAGATLLPGLIDAHFHLYQSIIELGVHWIDEAETLPQMTASIREYIAQNSMREHFIVRGLGHFAFRELEIPVRAFLDTILTDRPLLLFAFDDHMAWGNSCALERAGLLRGRATKGNSQVVVGPDGLASGELIEKDAYDPVLAILTPMSDVEIAECVRKGMELVARNGITSVHNMNGDSVELSQYQRLERDDALFVRVYCPRSLTPGDASFPLQEALDMRSSCRGTMVKSGAIKIFLDGVIEQETALLLDPYCSTSRSCGSANYTQEELLELFSIAEQHHMQIFVHSIGDGATRLALDAFQIIRSRFGARDSRHRLEHLEVVNPRDLPRLSALGVVASLQPLHWEMAMKDTDWQAKVGAKRMESIYPWDAIAMLGVPVAFGSDWNVAPCDPMAALSAALRRSSATTGPTRHATLRALLRHYTIDAAFAEFEEQHKGSIAPGMHADLCLLDGDLFTGDREPSSYGIRLTMCNGQVTHSML